LSGSPMWQFVQPHFSSVKTAKMYEEIFGLEDYGIVTPYINIAEQADAQRQVQVLQEQLHQEMGTATGVGEDHDIPPPGMPPQGQPGQGQPPVANAA